MVNRESPSAANRPNAADVSGWMLAEMARATEDAPSIDVGDAGVAEEIGQCAELLSRFWPVAGADGDRSGDPLDLSIFREGSKFVDAVQPGMRLGRFEIRRQLGHGGFGIVFLVFDLQLNREAALKIPRPEVLLSRPLRERFLHEAQAVAALDHPGIIPIFEIGQIGPVGYILSAFCRGPTLTRWLHEQTSPISPRVAARIVEQLAEAVQHAHTRGILHRDIKPSNVMLEPLADPRGELFPFVSRLSDFGLAKRLDESADETRSGILLGTPRYMAPEQAAGNEREIGVHTDVHAIGAVLHELLTRQQPFTGHNDQETLRKIQEDEPSPRPLRRSNVPRDLEMICLKCLQKKSADRYESARDLASDLRHFLAGEPVAARPLRRGQRLVRWCRRRPVIAALALGLIIAVASGAAVAGWQWYRAERHLADARALLYASNIKLGAISWEQGNVRTMQELLEPFAYDAKGSLDLRGWDWFYLHRLGRQETMTQVAPGQVKSLSVSPDGAIIAVGTKEGSVCGFDSRTAKKLWTVTNASRRVVIRVAFDPANQRLGTVDEEGVIRIWRVQPQPQLDYLAKLGYEVTAAAFDEGLLRLAIASPDQNIHLWDLSTSQQAGLLNGHTGRVSSLAYTKDASSLLSGSEDATVRLWNVATQQQSQIMEHPRKHKVFGTTIDSTGRFIAAGADDGSIVIWELGSPSPRLDLNGHSDAVNTVVLNKERGYLASGSDDRTIRIWELATGRLLRVLRGHVESVNQLIFLPQSGELVSGGGEGAVKKWNLDADDFAQPRPRLQNAVQAVFGPDGKRIACLFQDGRVTTYELPSWKELHTIGPAEGRSALAFDGERERIAVAPNDGTIQLWERTVHVRTFTGHSRFAENLAMSPNGKWLASGSSDKTTKLWDLATGRLVCDFGLQPQRVNGVAFSPDSTQLVWSSGNVIMVADPATGQLLHTLCGHSERVYNLAYSRSGDRLVSGDRFGNIIVWYAATGEQQLRLAGHSDRVYICAFSPDGRRLVSCSRDSSIRWWDLSTGRELLAMRGDWGPLEWLALSPDGWTLLAIETAGDLRTWDPRPRADEP